MDATILLQKSKPIPRESVEALLTNIAAQTTWQKISVAVAYCSVAGARLFYEVVQRSNPTASFRWLLGLDDFITQPGAIDFCKALPNSTLKVYCSPDRHSRFHPKIYLFHKTVNPNHASIVVGSANLTAAAFTKNYEAVSVIKASTQADINSMNASFDAAWECAITPSVAFLKKYTTQFNKHRPVTRFVLASDTKPEKARKTTEVLSTDSAERDPALSNICWIEVGKNTAMGRELEFKSEQALFFGLARGGGAPEMRQFIVSDGRQIQLRLKYQGNAMWRLQMTKDIPEVARGLRPIVGGKLQRSPYVAIFKRHPQNGAFGLSFVKASSTRFERVKACSKRLGTIGSTSSRQYGWY